MFWFHFYFFVAFYFVLDRQLHIPLRVHFTKIIWVRLYYILHAASSIVKQAPNLWSIPESPKLQEIRTCAEFGSAVSGITEVGGWILFRPLQAPVPPGKLVESDFIQIPTRMKSLGGQGVVCFVQYATWPVSRTQ